MSGWLLCANVWEGYFDSQLQIDIRNFSDVQKTHG